MKGMTFRGYGGKWHWTDNRDRFGFGEETSVTKDIIQSYINKAIRSMLNKTIGQQINQKINAKSSQESVTATSDENSMVINTEIVTAIHKGTTHGGD